MLTFVAEHVANMLSWLKEVSLNKDFFPETSSFVHEIIVKLEGCILVIIKREVKLVALKLFCGVYFCPFPFYLSASSTNEEQGHVILMQNRSVAF